MCGIVGYITTNDGVFLGTKDKFMREALLVDTLRGSDSTGVMSLTGDMTWSYIKNTVPGFEFIGTKGFIQRKDNYWCEVGHNRAATIGKITADNAHPFKQEDILLVHNGTLRDESAMPHANKDIEVDSELIAYNLAKEAPEDAHKVLEHLAGAFALVWFDLRDNTVNFVRNDERPFHLGLNSGGTAMWFGSDGNMLRMLVDRIDSTYATPETIYSIAAYRHLKFKKGDLKPEVKVIKAHAYKAAPITSRAKDWWPEGGSANDRPTDMPRNLGRGKNNNTMINGKLRKIPKAHLSMLNSWYTTESNDEMYFKQSFFIPWGDSDEGTLYGKVYHKEWDTYFEASLPGIRRKQLDNYGMGPWTVCPVGIDHTEISARIPGKITTNELTFICAVKWYSYTGKLPPVEETDDKTGDAKVIDLIHKSLEDTDWAAECEKARTEEEDVLNMLQGPNNHMITEEAFETLCQDGCCMCSTPILLADHWEIEWAGEMGNQPLCHACVGFQMGEERVN